MRRLHVRASRACASFESGHDLLALIVDELLDEQEVVVRPLGSILKRAMFREAPSGDRRGVYGTESAGSPESARKRTPWPGRGLTTLKQSSG
jgi:hypothetical protein